jgi:hypothetical protein
MKRRTLDIVFSVGGLLVAALILVLGLVLQNQANFAKDYVHDQLTAQQIVFTPEDKLTEEEKANTCLVVYAGEQLVTGKQAECYANDYIGLHLGETNDGKTYSQTSTESRAAAAAAKADPNNAELAAAAKTLDGKVQTLFRGETLRGLLLTSYGFSIFGERAGQAALVCFLVAGVLFLASIAGFIHAFTTDKEKKVLVAEG